MAYCKIKGVWVPPEEREVNCYKQLPKRVRRLMGLDKVEVKEKVEK